MVKEDFNTGSVVQGRPPWLWAFFTARGRGERWGGRTHLASQVRERKSLIRSKARFRWEFDKNPELHDSKKLLRDKTAASFLPDWIQRNRQILTLASQVLSCLLETFARDHSTCQWANSFLRPFFPSWVSVFLSRVWFYCRSSVVIVFHSALVKTEGLYGFLN